MKALLASLAGLALVSCASTVPVLESGNLDHRKLDYVAFPPPPNFPGVDHVVLIWLKRPGNAKDIKALRQAAEDLKVIPQVKSITHGTALASERPIVDDSFDVGFVMRFDSPADLHAYETHPKHIAKVNAVLKPLTKKIVVYDVVR